MDHPVGLGALFLSSFLAATLLPGGSELVLFALISTDAAILWPALGLATLGNTLGGLTSYLLGRLLPQRYFPERQIRWMRRHGAPLLLLSWAPIVGDALCVAAGWLRFNPLWASLLMATGKFVRYWVISRAALT